MSHHKAFLLGVILVAMVCLIGIFSVSEALAQVSISGTVYEADGVTVVGSGKTVTAAIATSTVSLHSATTNGSGEYTIAGLATSTIGTWSTSTASARAWQSVAYGNGLFVAVACGSATACNTTAATRVMTSPDGITWTDRSAASDDDSWRSVVYGKGMFVAVGSSGDRVMTSLDGITWTARSAAGNDDVWLSVTYGNDRFVAVAQNGDRAMYSDDGVNWMVSATPPAARAWNTVTYGNGLFVALACGSATTCNTTVAQRLATSTDGNIWTMGDVAGNNDSWQGITYGGGQFVAVSSNGDRIVTSPDGTAWTTRTFTPALAMSEVVYANGQYIALACGVNTTCNITATSTRQYTSRDGITWTAVSLTGNNDQWQDLIYAKGLFLTVAINGDRVATAPAGFGDSTPITLFVNNDTVDATTLFQLATSSSVVTGVDLITNTLSVQRATTSGEVNLRTDDRYDARNDSDILFTHTGIELRSSSTMALRITAGTTVAFPSRASVTGDVINNGTITEGTVRLMGTSTQMATGTGTYRHLRIDNTSGTGSSTQSVTFGASLTVTGMFTMMASTSAEFLANATSTIGTLDLLGMEGKPVWLRSSSDGSRFGFSISGSRAVQYVNVKDSNAFVGVASGTDSGNNSGWDFSERSEYVQGTVYTDTTKSDVIRTGSVSAGFVSESEPSGQAWNVRSAAENDDAWFEVTYGNGLFVAVGTGPDRVMTSPDGITWTARSAAGDDDAWYGVTYANGLFVAVGDTGDRVMTSPDGITWTARSAAGDNDTWRSVTYGNGLFVVVGELGDRVMTSPDGITWTARSAAGNDDSWRSVTYDNGLFVAVNSVGGTDNVMTSPDGITWTAYSAAGSNDAWFDAAYGNGLFVVVGLAGDDRVMTSPDGITWTARSATGNDDAWRSVTFTNGLFVAVGSVNDRVMTSPDGITWTARSAAGDNDTWRSVTYGGGLFVAVGTIGDRVMISRADGGGLEQTTVTDIFGEYVQPVTGVGGGQNWTIKSAAGNDDNWQGVTYGNGLFVAVAFGGTDRVMTSPDGITWTARSAAGNDDNWGAVTYSNGLFVAVGTGPDRVMTSPDGITWTARSAAGDDDSWYRITYGNGLFVAVAFGGTDRVMTSPDGITWTARSAAGDDDAWYGVTYANGLFVAVGTGPDRVMTSPDGITWTARSAAGDNDTWQGITYGNGLFVAVGFPDRVMTSPDGITWIVRSGTATINGWQGITYGNGLFVAVGTGPNNPIMTSPDGITWTARSAAGNNDTWLSVTYGGGFFVAVGSGPDLVVTSYAGAASTTLATIFLDDDPAGRQTGVLTVARAATGVDLVVGELTASIPGNGGIIDLTDNILFSATDDGSAPFNKIASTTAIGSLITPMNFIIATNTTLIASEDLEIYGDLTRLDSATFDANDGTIYLKGPDPVVNGQFTGVNSFSDLVIDPTSEGKQWVAYDPTEFSSWSSMAYGDGTFVAVGGTSESVMTSSDGVVWTPRSAAGDNDSWNAVAFGNGTFVAVGFCNGSTFIECIMYSTDGGVTWATTTVTGNNNTWNSVTYGNGQFVAVASNGTNRVMTSPDGITWTLRSVAGNNDSWQSVTFANGTFVAVGTGADRVMSSTNGTTWTVRTAAEANFWQSVTYGNGLFVAVSNTGTNRVMTSPDGSIWTAQSAAGNNDDWEAVTYGNNTFVAVGRGDFGADDIIMTSSDGVIWNAIAGASDNNDGWTTVVYGEGVFVAGAFSGNSRFMRSQSTVSLGTSSVRDLTTSTTSLTSVSSNLEINGDVLNRGAIGNNAVVTFTSSSSITTLGSDFASPLLGAVTVSGHATFTTPVSVTDFTVESGGSVTASTSFTVTGDFTQNGSIDFSTTTLLLGSDLYQIVQGNFTDNNAIKEIVSQINPVVTPRTIAGNNEFWAGVAYGGGMFVAVGIEGVDGERVAYSSDGMTWATSTATENASWQSITYGNDLFVAVSDDSANRVMTSPDGITWTARSAANNDDAWNAVTYGNGLFVAVSDCFNNGGDCVMYSSNGIAWSTSTAPQFAWSAVTYGNGLFVAVSSDGANRVMTSPDGIIWTAQSAAGDDDLWFDVTYGNGLFVAVSYSGDAVITSPNGTDWTVQIGAEGNFNWNSVAYGNGLFLVTSSDSRRFMVSGDGITWQQFPNAPYDCGCREIAYGNGLFVEIGSNRSSTIEDSLIGPILSSDVEVQQIMVEPFAYLSASSTISVAGDYGNRGRFNAGTSTIILNGTNSQTVSGRLDGQSAFNNLIVVNQSGSGTTTQSVTFGAPLAVSNTFTMTASSSAAFAAGATTTLENVSLEGTATSPVWLRSTVSGTDWYLDVPGDQLFVQYVNVQDSTASSTIIAYDSFDAGNNENWNFNEGGDSVSISGTLFEADGVTPVAGATISVAVATATSSVYTATTNSAGNFLVTGIATGTMATTSWVSGVIAANREWRDITHGNGRFVAVACGTGSGLGCSTNSASRVMTSLDGETFTTGTIAGDDDSWQSVTYGNGLFVAVSNNGDRIATSPDGVTWTVRTAPVENAWYGVTYGNGRFVAVACGTGTTCNTAVGDRVMYSDDGITWATATAAGDNDSWQSVAYGNGVFVAVSAAGNRAMTSPDGITWTTQSALDNDDEWNAVAYGNGIFMAVSDTTSDGDGAMRSVDGVTWTKVNGIFGSHKGVAYGNGAWVVVRCRDSAAGSCSSSGSTLRIFQSYDNGETWASIDGGVVFWHGATYGNSRFVALGNNAMRYNRTPFLDSVPLTIYVDNNTRKAAAITYIGTSTSVVTGITLRDGAVTLDHSVSGGVIDFSKADFYDANNDADIPFIANTATTTIGSTTRAANLIITPGTTVLAPQNLELYGNLTQNGSFRAERGTTYFAGLAGEVDGNLTSSNSLHNVTLSGGVWVERTSPIGPGGVAYRAVTYGNGRFVAVDCRGGATGVTCNQTQDSRVVYSDDGITWTAVTDAAGNNDQWVDVHFANNLFVAVSSGGDRVMTSPDGITWTARSAVGNDDQWFGVTYGNGLWVAVGNGPDYVMTSPDGITWTARTAAENNTWRSVVYADNLFIAVASVGTNRIMTSPDGITWTARTTSGGTADLFSVTYGNGIFVAVANAGTGARAHYSYDGMTWYPSENMPVKGYASVTYGNGVFVALACAQTSGCSAGVSTPRVAYSSDGAYWTEGNSVGDTAAWRDIIFAEQRFVAVSESTGAKIMTLDIPQTHFNTDISFNDISIRPTASLSAASSTLTVRGDFINQGYFSAGDSTVIFGGSDFQIATGSISGDNAFNNMMITNTTGDGTTNQSVSFEVPLGVSDTFSMTEGTSAAFLAGASSTVQNMSLQGSFENRIWLRSTTNNTPWYIDVSGNQLTVDFVDVKDSIASTTITARGSIDSGNNVRWLFFSVGSTTIANHDAGQVRNAFNFQDKTDEELFAFKLIPNSGNATVTALTLTVSGVTKVAQSDFTNLRLFADVNNNGLYNSGTDIPVGGIGTMTIADSKGTITFLDDFAVNAATNYLVIADWNVPENGSFMMVELLQNGVTIVGGDGVQQVFGSVDRVQHNRNNKGGGGGAAEDVGGAPPAGDPPQTGGGSGGGEQIGNDPNFRRPTTNTGENWSNPENAYNQVNNSYASRSSFTIGEENIFAGIGYAVPSNNEIIGIEVRLEASATENDGSTLAVQLASGEVGLGGVKTTPALTTTDTVIILGGPSDTWGRSWSAAEVNAIGLRIYQDSIGLSTNILLDEIQIRIYFQATGGGSGGGGDI